MAKVLRRKIFDATLIDDDPTSASATFDFNGVSPKSISIYVTTVEEGSGATVALTVEISPDNGGTLVSYDKLLTDAGTDAPAASVTYSATGDDVISLSPEDIVDYIKVTLTGTSTTSSNKYTFNIWLIYTI